MAGIPRHVVRSSTSAAANVVMPVRAPCSKSAFSRMSLKCAMVSSTPAWFWRGGAGESVAASTPLSRCLESRGMRWYHQLPPGFDVGVPVRAHCLNLAFSRWTSRARQWCHPRPQVLDRSNTSERHCHLTHPADRSHHSHTPRTSDSSPHAPSYPSSLSTASHPPPKP